MLRPRAFGRSDNSEELITGFQLLRKNAGKRIAAFLIDPSTRFLSANQFHLPMSHNEAGSYLSLAVETVSRVFTRFRQMKLLASAGKEVLILAPSN